MNRTSIVCSLVSMGIVFASASFAQDVELSAKALHQSLAEPPESHSSEVSRIITEAKMAVRMELQQSLKDKIKDAIVQEDPAVGSVTIIGGRVTGDITLANRINGVTIIGQGH
ncbi:MAG: hypothetical protein U0236_22410 [Nitrospira sp.]